GTISDLTDYNYDLTIDGLIDLKKLTSLYPIPDMQLSGKLEARVKSSGKLSDLEAKRFSAVKTKGSIELTRVRISGKELPHLIFIKEAKLYFNPDKIILKSFNGKFAKNRFAL